MTDSRYAETPENKRQLYWLLSMVVIFVLIIVGTELLVNFKPELADRLSNLFAENKIDWIWRNRNYDLSYLKQLGHSEWVIVTYYLQIVLMFYTAFLFVFWRFLIPIHGGRVVIEKMIKPEGKVSVATLLLSSVFLIVISYFALFVDTAGDVIDDRRDYIFGIPPRAHTYLGISVEAFFLVMLSLGSEGLLHLSRHLILQKLKSFLKGDQ
ncbi:MAG: hypothetical protein AAGA12_14765 [Pseudomonadota bacterium]